MTLCLVAGNTNCRLALFEADRVRARRAAPTARVLAAPGRFLAGLTAADAALASVLPAATRPLARALRELARLPGRGQARRPPFVLSARSRSGLLVRYDRRELGADRLCVAEGARRRWPGDLAVADFGTAVTLNFINADGAFEGGPILPGPGLMLAALCRHTGRLPLARFRPPAALFPRTTRPALAAGALAAVAGGIERELARVERETGRRWRLVGTGGAARYFARRIPRLESVDPDLGLRGLAALHALNRGG
ncbi:MAG: type III pantothenate kinase [bacterium]